MICTYKYRLYPSKKQAQTIDETLNRHRWLYNEALAQRKDEKMSAKPSSLGAGKEVSELRHSSQMANATSQRK